MILNLAVNKNIEKLKELIIDAINNKKTIEFNIKSNNITLSQKRALHLYFRFIADELNNLGLTYNDKLFNDIEIEIPYTEIVVKELIWKPIQKILFDKTSTTEITNAEINKIIDVITLHLSKLGLQVDFPNIQDFLLKKQYQ